ncbi:hypothetical protein AYY19_19550 [Photobacterium aquimaris]|uniref:type II toxin-antitoxin system YafO family toxin n=1 Tax=Photobacterium aquimaris TaxID=512643 RepID=UPI0007EFC1AE|nr:type II toxin-antitoxin system YafO family toxin [Photobacterium aquimaris]OBU13957.1 hypothetical protein AYY19_19550 [Photobacterium aquimaris]PSV98076.1 hypothetical protein CTM91_17000 [Photobacterium aquimaris]
MSSILPIVEVIPDPELELDDFLNFVIAEFKEYKTLSLSEVGADNFVAPNEGIQAVRSSVHNLFGRDRVFERPAKWVAYIQRENLTHVHFDREEQWHSDTPQWNCTSCESIVYSAFRMPDGRFVFVIHEFLFLEQTDNAHDNYEESDMDYYIRNAEYHRNQHSA